MCGGGFDFFKGLSLQLIDLNPQLSTLFFTRRKSFIFSFENSYNRNIGFWGLIREKRCGIAMYFRRTFSRHFITYTLFSWRWEEGGGVNDAIGEQIKEENHCVRLFFLLHLFHHGPFKYGDHYLTDKEERTVTESVTDVTVTESVGEEQPDWCHPSFCPSKPYSPIKPEKYAPALAVLSDGKSPAETHDWKRLNHHRDPGTGKGRIVHSWPATTCPAS